MLLLLFFYRFSHILVISSNVFPLVSGTIFQTKNADNTDIVPYKKYVNGMLNAAKAGKEDDTIKFITHCAPTAMATALPLMVFGNISEINTQQIGPHDIINAAE